MSRKAPALQQLVGCLCRQGSGFLACTALPSIMSLPGWLQLRSLKGQQQAAAGRLHFAASSRAAQSPARCTPAHTGEGPALRGRLQTIVSKQGKSGLAIYSMIQTACPLTVAEVDLLHVCV